MKKKATTTKKTAQAARTMPALLTEVFPAAEEAARELVAEAVFNPLGDGADYEVAIEALAGPDTEWNDALGRIEEIDPKLFDVAVDRNRQILEAAFTFGLALGHLVDVAAVVGRKAGHR